MIKNHNKGSIEIICGPMFSGKTEELIRRLKRSIIAKKKILVFKPKIWGTLLIMVFRGG